MCEAIENLILERNEIAEKRRNIEIAVKMLEKEKYSFEDISEITGLTFGEVEELSKNNSQEQ